jgi:hypothetical protein
MADGWDQRTSHIFSQIQFRCLESSWMHERMYEVLNRRQFWIQRTLIILGILAAVFGFLLTSIEDDLWRIVGGIFSGLIGIIMTFIIQQSEKYDYVAEATSHHIVADQYQAIYEDIELMKASPSLSAKEFLGTVRSMLRSLRDRSGDLLIEPDIIEEYKTMCTARGVVYRDIFVQISEIDGGNMIPVPSGTLRGYNAKQLALELDRLSNLAFE